MLNPFMTNALTFVGFGIALFGCWELAKFLYHSRLDPECRPRSFIYEGIAAFVLIFGGTASANSDWIFRLLSQ
jgi:hypothetical protein